MAAVQHPEAVRLAGLRGGPAAASSVSLSCSLFLFPFALVVFLCYHISGCLESCGKVGICSITFLCVVVYSAPLEGVGRVVVMVRMIG